VVWTLLRSCLSETPRSPALIYRAHARLSVDSWQSNPEVNSRASSELDFHHLPTLYILHIELPALSSKMPVPQKPLCEYAAADLLNATVPPEDARKEITRRLEIRRRILSSEQYDKLIKTKHCSDPTIPAEAFSEMGVLQVLNAMEAGKPGGIKTRANEYGGIVMTKRESVEIFGDDENDSCC
jgi:hypothetical protein